MRRGRPPYPGLLTPREQEVLTLLRDGLSNDQIADRLGISRSGAKYHVSEIITKLGVRSREQAAAWRGSTERRWAGVLLGLHWKKLALVGGGAAVVALALVLSALLFRDASPDQGKLAFVRDGNLWVKTLPNGNERQLTTAGNERRPVWSPSGDWLLVRLEPDATVMRGDGSGRRAVPGCSEWSPVADELLCTGDAGLYIESADGFLRRFLGVDGIPTWVGSSWSPDGSRIAFTRDGPLERTTDGEEGRLSDADGNFLSRMSSLWVVGADGSNASLLFENDGYLGLGGQVIIIGWLDDSVLYVLNPTFANSAPNDGLPLYLIPAGGGEAVETGAFVLLGPHLRDLSADLPPIFTIGGGRMLWADKQIGYLAGDGSFQMLTGGELATFAPAWSPDGRYVAYVSAPDVGVVDNYEGITSVQQRRIWLMERDGSGKRPLTSGAHREERPLWSSDGAFILHVRVIEDEAALWLVPVSGRAAKKVAVISSNPLSSLTTAGPAPWFGYYGQTDWDAFFDWWQP